MGFSSIAIEQREKEAKALKTFLLYSFIGSLALHLGVLALNISKFFLRVPKVKDQPIEVTILETIPQEVAKPQADKNSPVKVNSGGGGGGGNKGMKNLLPAPTSISSITPAFLPVVKQHQPKTTNNFITKQPLAPTNPIQKTTPEPATTLPPLENKPIQTLDKNSKNLASNEPQPNPTIINDTKTQNIQSSKLEIQPNPIPNNISTTSTSLTQQSSQNVISPSGNLIGSLGNRLRKNLGNASSNGVGNGSANGVGNGSGNGVGNGSGNGVGNGSGNGVGNGSGNGVGNKPTTKNTTVATAPKLVTENSSILNRADCLKCQIKYPDRARRRGVEGNVEVSINTDADGNVTYVILTRSSGDRELDEAAQQAAQEWKLKPTFGGRQGVRASVNFAIKGSQRHRQLQEQQEKKRREATQKKPETSSSNPTPITSPQHNQKITNPIDTDILHENITKPKTKSTPLPSQSFSPIATPSPEPVKSDTSNQSDETKTEGVSAPSSTTPPESNSDSQTSN